MNISVYEYDWPENLEVNSGIGKQYEVCSSLEIIKKTTEMLLWEKVLELTGLRKDLKVFESLTEKVTD